MWFSEMLMVRESLSNQWARYLFLLQASISKQKTHNINLAKSWLVCSILLSKMTKINNNTQ